MIGHSKRKSQAARRIRTADLDKLMRQCRTVLAREVERLMDISFTDKLSKDETASLNAYFKQIVELKKQESDYLESLSDEQLEKLAKEKTDE